jgi:hypothetical protein
LSAFSICWHALVDALVDALGKSYPLNTHARYSRQILTPGQAHDLARAAELIEAANPDALIADKAFDADPFIATLTQREITPVIAESEPQNPTALRFRALPRTQPRRAPLQ